MFPTLATEPRSHGARNTSPRSTVAQKSGRSWLFGRDHPATTKIEFKFKFLSSQILSFLYLISCDRWRVDHKFLRAWIVRRSRFQPSDERSVTELGLSVRSDNFAVPGLRHPLSLLFFRPEVLQSRDEHVVVDAERVALPHNVLLERSAENLSSPRAAGVTKLITER